MTKTTARFAAIVNIVKNDAARISRASALVARLASTKAGEEAARLNRLASALNEQRNVIVASRVSARYGTGTREYIDSVNLVAKHCEARDTLLSAE